MLEGPGGSGEDLCECFQSELSPRRAPELDTATDTQSPPGLIMRKSNKKNDIILRNILNIAKIKSKDKKTGGKAQTDSREEARGDKRTKDATDLKRWQLIESPWIYFYISISFF